MKLTKKIIKAIETKTNCSVNFDEKHYYIYVDNACGEDFSIDIYRGGREVENIIEDCDEIANNLKQLADLLRGFVK